jgi:SOS response associated peptidase (SRAP)
MQAVYASLFQTGERKLKSSPVEGRASPILLLHHALTAPVHDRMPVILDPDIYDLWLDPGMKDVRAVSDMLKPYNARSMRSYPVSTRINGVVNDDPQCAAPVELSQVQRQLFS